MIVCSNYVLESKNTKAMSVNKGYKITEVPEDVNVNVDKLEYVIANTKVYTYDEAIELTGNSTYNLTLLATLTLALLSMALNVFGISVIIPGATCDFNLNLKQTGILLSVTFLGPIVMAYPWGYISDTQGRRKSLLIGMWMSFIFDLIGAFSANWIMTAVLKFLSTSFSSCAQSAGFTLIGESCSKRVRDKYLLIMSSVLDLSLAVYAGIGYVIMHGKLSINLGFITLSPWRLVTVAQALPLGMSAVGLLFFYESPKFMLNMGKEKETLDTLKNIWRRNGCINGEFPVKSLVLNEKGNETAGKDVSLLRSLSNRITPLFKPPLLWTSLQLYFLTAIVFSTNNSYYIWFPFLAENFVEGLVKYKDDSPGLCSLVVGAYSNSTENIKCSTELDISLFWVSLAQGVTFIGILICISAIAYRKRLVIIIFLTLSGFSALGAVSVKNNIVSFVLFIGMFLNELIIGFIFSYFVDLYPTSYRGMAACLATMVARGSALGATNLLGSFIVTHCTHTFYISAALILIGACVAFLLPRPVKRK